jgi:hypothetical protein
MYLVEECHLFQKMDLLNYMKLLRAIYILMEYKARNLNNGLMLFMQTAAFICLQWKLLQVRFFSKWLLMTLDFGLFSEFINMEG